MRVCERGRLDVLGSAVRGERGVRGDGGNTASAGTSSPSFRRSRSSLACLCVLSDGTSEWDEPELAEGAFETRDGALDRTDPRRVGAADWTPRWVGLRLLQVESVSRAGTGPATMDDDACETVAIIRERKSNGGITMKGYVNRCERPLMPDQRARENTPGLTDRRAKTDGSPWGWENLVVCTEEGRPGTRLELGNEREVQAVHI